RRRPHRRHHRSRQQRPATRSRRLGRTSRLGLGRQSRARRFRIRHLRRRQARRHRRPLPLRKSGSHHHVLRSTFRHRLCRLFRCRWRKNPSPQFWRAAREHRLHFRISLDGRQLPQICRPAHRRRFARRRPRTNRPLCPAPRLHQLRLATSRRRLGRRQRHVCRRRHCRPGLHSPRQESSRHLRFSSHGNPFDRRRHRLPPTRRRPHHRPQLANLPAIRLPLFPPAVPATYPAKVTHLWVRLFP